MTSTLRHGRPWRRLPADLFRFTATESSALHIAVMAVLAEAAVSRPALSFDDIHRGLVDVGWDAPLTDDQLHSSLTSLLGWQLVEATQNYTARYATPEEFERRNLQYSITARGQAGVAGVTAGLDALARSASLQPAVIDAIAEELVDLHRLITHEPSNTNRIYTGLMAVEAHHQSLVDNIRQFNTELQRLIGDDATTDDIFLDVKQRIVSYLQEYVTGIEAPTRRVAHAIDQVIALGPATLFDLALVGANLAPLGDADPGPVWLAERSYRWSALRSWFRPAADLDQPQIRSVTDVAEQAIIQLLRVLERRWESRRRSASLDQDFRRLADWFASAPDEASAHRLFQAAFGIWPSRHAHLLPEDHEAIPTTASWLDVAPVVVAPTLRTSGTVGARGRSRPVEDPAIVRARRQREQAELLARSDELRRALATGGTIALSTFAELDTDQFAELLGLLNRALTAPAASDGSRRSMSVDGQVEIVLGPARDGATAELRTPGGVLTAPDFPIEIIVTDANERTGSSAGTGGTSAERQVSGD